MTTIGSARLVGRVLLGLADPHGSTASSASTAGSSSAGHDHDSHHGHTVDIYSVSVLTTILVFFSLLVEFITHHLEIWLAKKNLLTVLMLLYKELMIMGLCTLLLFFEEQWHFMAKIAPGGNFDGHLFHSIHMALFLSVISYITCMCIMMVVAMRFSNSLKPMEEGDYNEVKRKFAEMDKKGGMFACISNRNYNKMFYQLEYLSTREHFIDQHKLPADFPFWLYVKFCTKESVQHLAGVHWSVWVIILLAAFLDTVRNTYLGEDTYGGSIQYMVLVYLSFLIATAAFFKMRKIKTELLLLELTAANTLSHDPEGKSLDPSAWESDEEDEHGGGHGHGGHNPTAGHAKSKHLALFWFGKPKVMARLIQFVVLTQAITIPVYITYFAAKWAKDSKEIAYLLNIFAVLPAAIIIIGYLPYLLPNYIFATSIGELSKKPNIRETLEVTPSVVAAGGYHAYVESLKGRRSGGGHGGHGSSSGGHGKSSRSHGSHGGGGKSSSKSGHKLLDEEDDHHGGHGGHGGGHDDHHRVGGHGGHH